MIDSANYYYAAYLIVALIYSAYTLSLVVRLRRARRRLESLSAGSGPTRP